MPLTRIAMREGKSADYKQALLDEIYEAMRETVGIKTGPSATEKPSSTSPRPDGDDRLSERSRGIR